MNIWGINKDKEVDSKGKRILCTLEEFEEAMEFNDDNIICNDLLNVEDDNLGKEVTNYYNTHSVNNYNPTYICI